MGGAIVTTPTHDFRGRSGFEVLRQTCAKVDPDRVPASLTVHNDFERGPRFICEKLPQLIRDQLGVTEVCDPHLEEIFLCLWKITDEVDSHTDFQSLLAKCPKLNKESFMRVAFGVFSDGIFNWGRVVTLFLFAYRLVVKFIADNTADAIKEIIRWTLEYIKDHVLDWIRRQGGWEASLSYLKKPKWQKALLWVGIAVIVVFAIRKFKGTGINKDK